MKVIIARDASAKTKKLMAAQFPADWQVVTVEAGDLITAIRDADVIIPEGAVIDRRLLAHAQRLKLIQTGAGYDNVDIEGCTERGIWVANAAGINARAVAEHVFAFILCWYKNLALLDGGLKLGGFHMDYRGAELSDKVIDGLFFHKKRFQFFAANILRVLKGKPPRNALNDPVGQCIEPDSRIIPVILPEGYNGKILLISVSGDGIKKSVLIRSGDLWHREILRNTEAEFKRLGFENARVHELGGAWVRFEPDGAITVYGASNEFGACDKEFAAQMIRKEFRARTVRVRP